MCPAQHLISRQRWSVRRKRRTIRHIPSFTPQRLILSPSLQILWMRSHFPDHPVFELCRTRFPYPPHLVVSAYRISQTTVWTIPVFTRKSVLAHPCQSRHACDPSTIQPHLREQWRHTSLFSRVLSLLRGQRDPDTVLGCRGNNSGRLFWLKRGPAVVLGAGEDRSPGTGDEVPTPKAR